MVQMNEILALIRKAKMVSSRLERLSADSVYQHRSSGLRGSLLKFIEQVDSALSQTPLNEELWYDLQHLDLLIRLGLEILTDAAREIPAGDIPRINDTS